MTGLSQVSFGEKYGIPMRSIQNWESGQRECPGYVAQLLERVVKEDFSMNKLSDIEVLMKDGCSKEEAEKHLKRGTIVYEDFDENFETYMEDWGVEEESIDEYKKMVETKTPVEDWGVVEHQGKTYYISYCL